MRVATVLLFAAACASSACQTSSGSTESLATTRVTADFSTYTLRRIGVLPMQGPSASSPTARALQSALVGRLAERAHAEIVLLAASDLEAVPDEEGFRLGYTSPQAVLTLARRFRLDGIVVGTITDQRDYQPLRVALEVELIACETGQPLWTSTVRLDAAQERVRRALEGWLEHERKPEESGESSDLYLLSPLRFAEFAAAQAMMSF